jgi:hypothetical protein
MTAMVGDNYWIVVGPIVFTVGLLAWLGMVLWARRRERQGKGRGTTRGRASHRGPVSGGIIEGSPVQRTRRDEAPRHDS